MGSESLSAHIILVATTVLIQLLCLSTCVSISGIRPSNETDRVALLEFKSMISSDPLGALNSWNSSVHLCQWYGVSCSKTNGRVTILDLHSQGLSGSISPHIGNLSFLKELKLYNNSLIGEIPHEIGRLGRLQQMVLYNNSLGGEIPSNISGCSALTLFQVDNNKLVGGLPWQFGLLNKLQNFTVMSNMITGTIPPSFGNLSSLTKFEVTYNQLSGGVPDALGQVKGLQFLALDHNHLYGEIPASILNLSSLTDVWFSDNQFHGSLHGNIGISLPKLQSLNVNDNQFTGSVPPSLSNASNLIQLQLQGNNFTGSMPSMEASSKLMRFQISYNYLGSGKSTNNDLSFLSSLTNATRLEYVEFRGNNFEGHLPQHIGNLSATLKYLDFCHNKISGSIPSGIQYLVNLEGIIAYYNYLSGTIPSGIGKLHSLRLLMLYHNNISGHVPFSIGNLTKLIHLDIGANHLQGEIPASIQNCQELLELDLSRNSLSGAIPPQVMDLTSLSIGLDLSDNQLTGALPEEVGNLKNVGMLSLSHNMLSGTIPTSLGSCVSLEYLNLSGNLLQGTIPSSLSSLRGIQLLDLSTNNLSGQIPNFLEHIDITEFLNLSYNNFEGQVPQGGVFKNATIFSVTGNSKLCGGMALLNLPSCNNLATRPRKALNRKWKIVISATISSLLLLTFMGSCLFILWVNKNRGKQDTSSVVDDQQLLHLSYQRLYEATDGFSAANLIGAGSFGSVYKGALHENGAKKYVAVKVLNLERHGAFKSSKAECEALKNIKHVNLMKIVTVCSSVDHHGSDFKALIYEFLVNGSLDDWLHPVEKLNEPTRSLNFLQRVNVGIDIASAVDYLHNQCGTRIVHCDLKPSNVLLDEDMVAHVGDFGLARILSAVANPSSSSIGVKGTVGYAPPEYGMGNEVSVQGDVYSYGILLLELFTGRRPTDETFREGLDLHNFVKSALTQQRTMEVVDPILLNELLRTLTTHRNYTDSSSEESRKDVNELLSSILEIGVICSTNIPDERIDIREALSMLAAVKKFPLVQRMGDNSSTGSSIWYD